MRSHRSPKVLKRQLVGADIISISRENANKISRPLQNSHFTPDICLFKVVFVCKVVLIYISPVVFVHTFLEVFFVLNVLFKVLPAKFVSKEYLRKSNLLSKIVKFPHKLDEILLQTKIIVWTQKYPSREILGGGGVCVPLPPSTNRNPGLKSVFAHTNPAKEPSEI